jgi:aspartate/methionine/tyrosine aminotransferase
VNGKLKAKILNGGTFRTETLLDSDSSCNILSMFSRRTRWNLETNSFTRAVHQYRRSGAEVFDLTASNPTQVGLKLDADAVLRAISHFEALEYDPQPLGLHTARLAIAEYYDSLRGEVVPERLLLTTSTSEAYSFAFRLLCDPDDEVLIPTPSYPLFEYLAQIQDVRLVPYELVYDHGWQIDFHSLERAITARTRAIILVNPNNPTGSFVRESERSQLNHFCREHSLALIVDEVFFDFNLSADSFASFARNREVLTFTLSGLSKVAGLPQMKVAWIATTGPKELVEPALERLEVIADTYLSMSAPIQHAIPEFLKFRTTFQAQLMERLRTNLSELDRQLNCQKTLTRLALDGGWYATVRVPVTRSDEQLAIALLEETGVLTHPGHFFDFVSDGYLVLSLMTPEREFAEGVARLMRFFEAI